VLAGHAVAGAGISGSTVRDLMLEAVEPTMAVRSPRGRRSTSPPPSAWCHASPGCRARSRTASLKPSSKHSSATTLAYSHRRTLLQCFGNRRVVRRLQREPPSFWARNDLPQGVHSCSDHVAGCPVKRGQHQPSLA
jgi:hypothetical protein